MKSKAAEIFGVDEVEFIEPSYDRLVDDSNTALLLTSDVEEMRLLVDPEEWPLALSVKRKGKWLATNFLYHPPSMLAIEKFESANGRVFEEERSIWIRAVRDYYSRFIANMVPPAIEDFSKQRMIAVADLLSEVWGEGDGKVCLDCGCGSGIGSEALRAVGYIPLSIDNDSSLLSLGLSKGRLDPECTILLDATVASRYLEPVDAAIVLMAGSINNFNAHIWKAITEQVLQVSDKSMITTETKKEIEEIKKWAESVGSRGRIFENKRDPFYDRWVCVLESD